MALDLGFWAVESDGSLHPLGAVERHEGAYVFRWSTDAFAFVGQRKMFVADTRRELAKFAEVGLTKLPSDMKELTVYAHPVGSETDDGVPALYGARLNDPGTSLLVVRAIDPEALVKCCTTMTGFLRTDLGDAKWPRCVVPGCGVMHAIGVPLCMFHWAQLPVKKRGEYWVAGDERPTVLASLVRKYITKEPEAPPTRKRRAL